MNKCAICWPNIFECPTLVLRQTQAPCVAFASELLVSRSHYIRQRGLPYRLLYQRKLLYIWVYQSLSSSLCCPWKLGRMAGNQSRVGAGSVTIAKQTCLFHQGWSSLALDRCLPCLAPAAAVSLLMLKEPWAVVLVNFLYFAYLPSFFMTSF